jgi:CRP/FNR family transcriptional regulator, cyclic AMP receptor protein
VTAALGTRTDAHPASECQPLACEYRPRTSFVRSEPAGAVKLLVEDPDLARHLRPDETTALTRLAVAHVRYLEPGYWDPALDPSINRQQFGLLVLSGVLSRRVEVGRRRGAELVAAGDLLRPAQPYADPYALVEHRVAWRALTAVRFAVLDEELVGGLVGWHGVLGELVGRAVRRAHACAVLLAIAQTPDLATRLSLLLWHLADRWGRRQREGVVLRLPFGHETLSELAAAQRTSVTEALTALERRGSILRRGRGHFVLSVGSAPSNLTSHLAFSEAAVVMPYVGAPTFASVAPSVGRRTV